jgi:hypothetical protein
LLLIFIPEKKTPKESGRDDESVTTGQPAPIFAHPASSRFRPSARSFCARARGRAASSRPKKNRAAAGRAGQGTRRADGLPHAMTAAALAATPRAGRPPARGRLANEPNPAHVGCSPRAVVRVPFRASRNFRRSRPRPLVLASPPPLPDRDTPASPRCGGRAPSRSGRGFHRPVRSPVSREPPGGRQVHGCGRGRAA